MNVQLPVVVIGAGPVGLAAAAHLIERGLTPLILEAGASVGAGMLTWKHVRMFSPWEFSIDRAARALLNAEGWREPDLAAFPTGGELVERYLRPLAETPALQPYLRLGAKVVSVARHRVDLMKNAARNAAPFSVRYEDEQGEHEVFARAVIDASGTAGHPNPLGSSGVPAMGERAATGRIFYGIPDVLGDRQSRYSGKRVLVLGSGHSAFNVLKDLAQLRRTHPETHIQWAIRRDSLRRVLGGGNHDQLRERGALGMAIGRLVETGQVSLATGFHLDRLTWEGDGVVAYDGDRALSPVDEVVATTGFRPDLALLSELRLSLDPATQAPTALAPLIDPNLHSCGSVRPHGADQLRHPEENFYIVGMKSYGRAPTFLLLTGYEQARSVAAAIADDWEAARRVELVLPETGVCITQFADDEVPAPSSCCDSTAPAQEVTNASCCGGPATQGSGACCVKDEQAKAQGEAGCGCSPRTAPVVASCCA